MDIFKRIRTTLFLILVSFLFFLCGNVGAEVNNPYVVDYKSRVTFGDSSEVDGYKGLENYQAQYIDEYLHLSYTITHGQQSWASFPPYLYFFGDDPTVPPGIGAFTVGSADLTSSYWNPTDYYFVNIQFSRNGYRTIVTRGRDKIPFSDNTSSIDGITDDVFVALANYATGQNEHSMAFQPMRIVEVAPSKFISFNVSTTTRTALVETYIAPKDMGAWVHFTISDSSENLVFSGSPVIATTSGVSTNVWQFPEVANTKTTQSQTFYAHIDLVYGSTTLRTKDVGVTFTPTKEGYPGHSNSVDSTSEYIDYAAQTLGTNLSGTLTQIDITTSNIAAIYYGSRPVIDLFECENDTYAGLPLLGGIGPGSGCTIIFSDVSGEASGLSTSTQHFYTPPIIFNPSKYYFFRVRGNNLLNILPIYYGSSEDKVDGACYRLNYSNGQAVPCSTISDLSFYLRGVTKTVSNPLCTENCNSNIMFFPGIMGSRLYDSEEKELWVSSGDSLQAKLSLDETGKSNNVIYIKDDTLRKEGEVDEKGIVDDVYGSNIYESFINDLRTWKGDGTNGIIHDYALIPYDWRLSLNDIVTNGATSTQDNLSYATPQDFSQSYIVKQLEQLQKSSRTGKVAIVAHSNGGFVTKALIQKLKDTNNPLYNKIDKVIFVAVPQVGTPEGLTALLHGTSMGPWGSVMINARSRDLAKNMPTAYNLLPSSDYFSIVDPGFAVDKVVSFQNTHAFDRQLLQYGMFISNEDEFKRYVLNDEGRAIPTYADTTYPATGNRALYNMAETVHSVLDNWLPASTTKVVQVAGWGEETLAGIDYTNTGRLSLKLRNVVDGDGTVVVPSALWMSTSTPNVERWWVDLKTYSDKNLFSRVHKDILEIQNLRTFIKSQINNSPFSDSENIVVNSTQTLISDGERLHFTLHSPLTLGITDSSGRYTGLDSVTGKVREEIPGVTYKQYGEVQFLSVPAGLEYTVTMKGYESGSFDFDVEKQAGNAVIASTTFESIPSATSTTVTLNVSSLFSVSSSTLFIDQNSDGTPDISLKANESGVTVYDTTSPTITVNADGTLGMNGFYTSPVTITFTADDPMKEGEVSSGVASTTYSFDRGITWNTYSTTSPLLITAQGTTTIQYYSLDNNGNQEKTKTLTFTIDTISPVVVITTPNQLIYTHSDTIPLSITSTDDGGVASTTITVNGREVADNSVDLFFQRLGTTMVSASVSDMGGNTSSASTSFRIIATASSTISDITRAFTLGWITKENIKDILIKKIEKMVKLEIKIDTIIETKKGKRVERRIERIEERIDKTLAKALLLDLKAYERSKINERAYTLIKGDVEWLINY